MRIEDLDEFEGLTAEMVRAWLRAEGCVFDGTWARPYRPTPYYWDGQLLCPSTLGHIAYDFGYPSLQSLLREINPRMRPGWPTDEELGRHPLWLVSVTGSVSLAEEGTLHIRSAEKMRGLARLSAGTTVACWPCDANGNKVRRWTVPA